MYGWIANCEFLVEWIVESMHTVDTYVYNIFIRIKCRKVEKCTK